MPLLLAVSIILWVLIFTFPQAAAAVAGFAIGALVEDMTGELPS